MLVSNPDLPPHANDGSSLVLLVGAPRSGTTWLQKLLGAHPSVHTGQESEVLLYANALWKIWYTQIDPNQSGRGGIGLGCYLTQEQFFTLTKEYVDKLLAPLTSDLPPGHIFLDKTPHHTAALEHGLLMHPKIKVIHLLRDGRDVSASLIAASKGWGKNWAPRSLSASAKVWRNAVRNVRRSPISTLSDQYLEVRYEDLIVDTATEIRRLIQFLGFNWTEQEIAATVEANNIENLRAGQGVQLHLGGEFAKSSSTQVVREPTGFVRKGKIGSWRDEFSMLEKLQLYLIIGEELVAHGYTWDLPFGLGKLLDTLRRLYRSLKNTKP